MAARDLRTGTRLSREHLAFKRPGGGLAPIRISEILGRSLARDLAADEQLSLDDVSK